MTLADIVKAHRRHCRLTVIDLAIKLQMSTCTISKIEHGYTDLSLLTFKTLSKELGIKTSDLIRIAGHDMEV